MKECKTVKEHREKNKGGTDIKWLETHIKSCKTCQAIMVEVKQIVSDNIAEW